MGGIPKIPGFVIGDVQDPGLGGDAFTDDDNNIPTIDVVGRQDPGATSLGPAGDFTPTFTFTNDPASPGGIPTITTPTDDSKPPTHDIHSSEFHEWLTRHLGTVGDKIGAKIDSLGDTISDPLKLLNFVVKSITGVDFHEGTFDLATLIGTAGTAGLGGVASIVGGIDSLANLFDLPVPKIDIPGLGNHGDTTGASGNDSGGTPYFGGDPEPQTPSGNTQGPSAGGGDTTFTATPVIGDGGNIGEIIVNAHNDGGDLQYHLTPGDLTAAGLDPSNLDNINWADYINHQGTPGAGGEPAPKPEEPKPKDDTKPKDTVPGEPQMPVVGGDGIPAITVTGTHQDPGLPLPVIVPDVPNIVVPIPPVDPIVVAPPPAPPVHPPTEPITPDGPGPASPGTPVPPPPAPEPLPPAPKPFKFFAQPNFKLLPNDFGDPTLMLHHDSEGM